jgi:hypothetical protein
VKLDELRRQRGSSKFTLSALKILQRQLCNLESPSHIKGRMQQRKNVLVRGSNKSSNKNTAKIGHSTNLYSISTWHIFYSNCRTVLLVILSGGGKRKSSNKDLDGHSEVRTRELTNIDVNSPICITESPLRSESNLSTPTDS